MTFYDLTTIVILLLSIVLFVVIMTALVWVSWWWSERRIATSPYTGLPLRKANDLPYSSRVKILRYMETYKEYDNRAFNLGRAAFCRDTGRVFPNCINWLGEMKVDWHFLYKRYPGKWVSWGSLTAEQKQDVIDAHEGIKGFQMEESCSNADPEDIELNFIQTKPGSLYVDIETKVLLGWKCVFETEFEILIVQIP